MRTRGSWLRLAAVAGACCALWALFLRLDFVGFMDDAFYYLEPAMNAARGRGVVTNILYPAQIAALKGAVTFPAPFLWHGPLAPALMGWCIRAAGMAPWGALLYSFGLTLLTGLCAYALGRESGDEAAALLGAALYWTAVGVWRSSVGELTDPLFSFFVAVSALLLWLSRRGSSGAWCFGAGLALAAASCARLAGQVYWPGFLVAAFALHRRAKPALALLGGLLLGMLPLLAYNWNAAHILLLSPGFYLLLYSRSFPGAAAATSYLGLTSGQALLAYPKDILIKALTGPLYGVNFLLGATLTPWLSVLLTLGLLRPAPSQEGESWRRTALWLCVPVFVANLLLADGGARYLEPLYALAAPLAARLLLDAIQGGPKSRRGRRVLGACLAAWALLSPVALQLKDAYKTRAARAAAWQDLARLGAWVADAVPEGGIVYTDDPPTVAWHSGRPAVHLGRTLDDTRKTLERAPASAFVLTSLRLHSSDYDDAFRAAFREGAGVLGYAPCLRFEAPAVKALLLAPEGKCPAPR